MQFRRILSVVLVLAVVGSLIFFNANRTTTDLSVSATANQLLAVPFIGPESALTTSWYCPGVPANDLGITGAIVVSNPSTRIVTGTITFLGDGQPPLANALSVPALSTILINALPGIGGTFVSAMVEINGGVGSVEQRITHQGGDSIALCANAPAQDWFFADGFTGADSIEQIVLTNPYSDSTVVDISFVTLESKREPANLQGFVLLPQSVTVLSMADQGARNERVVAVSVRASSGRLIAGRSQHYLGQGRLGYTMSLGASATSDQWWFPDGEKVPGIAEQLVIFNPGDTDRTLSVLFITTGEVSSSIEPATITAPAGRVVTFNTASLPSLPDGRYGILVAVVDSPSDLEVVSKADQIVVEQVINRGEGSLVGTSVVLGVPTAAASTTWVAPSGTTAGLEHSIVVLNTTSDAATVTVQSIGPAGAVAISGLENIVIAESGLTLISVPIGLPVGQLILRATTPVIVQRLLDRGHELPGRSAVMAIPVIPSPIVTP